MQTEEEEKKDVNDTELRKRITQHIYRVYYELMEERNISKSFSITMILIMTLQLIGYIYNERADYPFDDSLHSTISKVLGVIRIYPAIEQLGSSSLYWTIQYLFFALIIIYFLQLIYVDHSITIGKYFVEFPVKILRHLSILFFWVLLTPIVEVFISIYNCADGYHTIDTSVECWNGIHIFYCFFFTLGLVLLFALEFLVAIYYNESRPNVTDGLRRLDMSMEFYLLIYRTFISIISHFTSTETYNWFLSIIYTLGSFYFLLLFLRRLPFYDNTVSTIYGICTCSYFWTSLNLLAIIALKNTAYSGQSIIIFVGILIIIPLMKNVRDQRIQYVLFSRQYNKLAKEYEFEIYISCILQLLHRQNRDEVEELLLLGFMSNHKAICKRTECPLKRKDTLTFAGKECVITETNLSNSVIVLSLIAEFYKIYSKVTSFGAALHISYSVFSLIYMNNVHLSIVELDNAMKLSPSLQQMFTIYRDKRIIEESLIGKCTGKDLNETERRSFHALDVTIVIKFENLSTKLYAAIDKAVNEHIEFWSQLDSLLPDLNTLHKLGLDITNYNIKIEKIWKQLYKLNPDHHKTLQTYGSYLKNIQNDDKLGAEYMEKARALEAGNAMNEHLNDFSIMFADDTAIIVMSAGSKETQGKIVKTNTGITNLFRYNPLEVIGYDISILMPKEIGSYHNQFLEQYFKNGKERIINTERELYAVRRSGALMCVSTMVKLVPSIKDDIQYIGLIRERNKDCGFILTNTAGRIDSISEVLIGQLGIPQNFLKENEVYVQFIFPDLINLEEDVNKKLYTKFDRLEGKVEITFMLPKDFLNLIKKYNKFININDHQDTPETNKEFFKRSVSKEVGELPESVREVAHFIHGGEFDENEVKNSKNILRKEIEYEESERQENWIIEVKNLSYGDGICRLKVFRIFNNKRNEEIASEKVYNQKSSPRKPRGRFIESLHHKNPENKNTKILDENNKLAIKKVIDTSDVETPINRSQPMEVPENYKDATDNANDISACLNNSRFENIPLALNTSIMQHRINRESYLQKHEDLFSEQKEVIKGLLKANEANIGQREKDEGKVKKESKMDKNDGIEDEGMSDEVGSIVSSTKSLMKHIIALRNAVYEQYCPTSVQQLIYVGRLVFLALFIISFLYYLITRTLYRNLKTNAANVMNTKDRLIYITSMGGCTRTLILLNPSNGIIQSTSRSGDEYYKYSFEGLDIKDYTSMTYEEYNFYCIEQSAKSAKVAQNELSTTGYVFYENTQEYINPSTIKVSYKEESQIAGDFNLDCWSAIMGLTIHGLKIKDMLLNEITIDNESVHYIMENSFNNILDKLHLSLEYMEKDTDKKVSKSIIIIMILLIVASVLITISLVLVLRVTLMVTNNKEGILKLFIDIPSKNVKDQLIKCRSYLLAIQDLDKMDAGEGEVGMDEAEFDRRDETKENYPDENETKNRDETAQLVDEHEQEMIKQRHSNKQKKFKAYSKNILKLIIEFALFVFIFGGYFIAIFIRSSIFLSNTMDLMVELITMSSQFFESGLLYKVFQEYIGSNGTMFIQHIDSEIYIFNKLLQFIEIQESFLKQHSENLKLNGGEYNSIFNSLVYDNICEHLLTKKEDKEDCTAYPILGRGLHSATIAYWSTIREFANTFKETKNTTTNSTLMVEIINNEEVVFREVISKRYLSRVYRKLLNQLNNDLYNNINREQIIIMTCFIVFCAFLILYYIFLWTLFVESTRNSLWVTKCMLGIIPFETILEVPNIKNFLINSSRGLIVNLGSG